MATKKNNQSLTAKEKKAQLLIRKEERDRVIATMTPALKALGDKVIEKLTYVRDKTLEHSWKLGQVFKSIVDNEAKYGVGALQQLAIYTGYSYELLYQSMRFYTGFDEKELKELMARRTAISGNMVTYFQALKLASVDDKKVRTKLLDDICENDWTFEELNEHMRTLGVTKTANAGSGRPVAIPSTLSARLENFSKIAHVIVRNKDLMWMHDEYGFLPAITEIPADKITPDLVAKFDRQINDAEKAIETLTAVKEELEKAREKAQERADEQAKLVEEQAVEEETKGKGKK